MKQIAAVLKIYLPDKSCRVWIRKLITFEVWVQERTLISKVTNLILIQSFIVVV